LSGDQHAIGTDGEGRLARDLVGQKSGQLRRRRLRRTQVEVLESFSVRLGLRRERMFSQSEAAMRW
jgi:hypothetical protein